MKELEKSEVECVSGGFINDVLGGMFHKDAHDGPGGLYGPGGQLESAFSAFEAYTQTTYGIGGMQALSAASEAFASSDCTYEGNFEPGGWENPDRPIEAYGDLINDLPSNTGNFIQNLVNAALGYGDYVVCQEIHAMNSDPNWVGSKAD